MKTPLKSANSLARNLLGLLGTVALANSLALTCGAAAFDSPAGTWDFLGTGGKQTAITVLTFSNDFTFKGYELLVPKLNNGGGGSDGRDGSTGNSRGDSGSSSGSSSGTSLFGFGPISGPWHFDPKGKVVGFFTEVVSQSSQDCMNTNLTFSVTNFDGTLTYEAKTNFTVCFTGSSIFTNITWSVNSTNDGTLNIFTTNLTFNGNTPGVFTNAVNFTAKVTPNKRLTMVGTTSVGKMTYNGIPAAFMQDISGSWYGLQTLNKQPFNEFFDLTSFQVANPFPGQFPDIAEFPNIYFTTNGVGPGYTVNVGVTMVSLHKKIGFAFVESPNGLRATLGNFTSNKSVTRGKTKGIIDPGTPVSFDATLLPPGP
jgi:hypothetical protein